MQTTSGFGFFPAPSPSGSISADSVSTADMAIYADVPAQDVYAQQLLQSPPQQLQLQLHELHLLIQPHSQRAHVGAHALEPPYGAAEQRQTTQPGGASRGSTWSNRNRNADSSTATTSKTSRTVRRRISRACDQCNQLRTKCDGQHPCLHCLGAGLICAYIRARKKRGKASRRELAQKLAEATPAPGSTSSSSDGLVAGYRSRRGASETYMQAISLDDLVNLDNLDDHMDNLGGMGGGMNSLDSLDHLGDLTDLPDLPDLPSQMDKPPAASTIDLDGFNVHGHDHKATSPPALRYPMLAPLLPHLVGILSAPAACDLVDAYFSQATSSAASALPHGDPLLVRLPFALDFVVRRRAILHPAAPRACRPALLASMLWVAATTMPTATDDDDGGDNGDNTTLCRALWKLTITLLPPPLSALSRTAVTDASTVATHPLSVDDVVTCIHLAVSVLTPEDDGLTWWHAAWSLARRLQLGRETPDGGAQAVGGGENDEAGEERRRVWWLVYMADRRLALEWRRPLFLLDAECADLRQPAPDEAWQAEGSMQDARDGTCGPLIACSSGPPGFYSTLLPLMVLVGETVDLLHVRSHPLLGSRQSGNDATPWDIHATALVTQHLSVFEQSLELARPQSKDDDAAAIVYTTYAANMVGLLRNLLARGWNAAAMAFVLQPFGRQANKPVVKTE